MTENPYEKQALREAIQHLDDWMDYSILRELLEPEKFDLLVNGKKKPDKTEVVGRD